MGVGLLSIVGAEQLRILTWALLCGLQSGTQGEQCLLPALEEQALAGTASYYGPRFHGRRTANGERFNKNAMTAAHPFLPFGTILKVKNVANSKESFLRINDRGPYVDGRVIDVSEAAARELDFIDQGLTDVEISVIRLPFN